MCIRDRLCAAFGAGIDPLQPTGAFVIDIGGGTTDMAVISQGSMSQIDTPVSYTHLDVYKRQ